MIPEREATLRRYFETGNLNRPEVEELWALIDQLRAEREQRGERLREISELLAEAGIPGGTTLAGGVILLRERAEKAEALERALRSLANEAHATVSLEEPELRRLVGHTNVNCLNRRIEEARALAPRPAGGE